LVAYIYNYIYMYMYMYNDIIVYGW
jgi:hypothetical protein